MMIQHAPETKYSLSLTKDGGKMSAAASECIRAGAEHRFESSFRF